MSWTTLYDIYTLYNFMHHLDRQFSLNLWVKSKPILSIFIIVCLSNHKWKEDRVIRGPACPSTQVATGSFQFVILQKMDFMAKKVSTECRSYIDSIASLVHPPWSSGLSCQPLVFVPLSSLIQDLNDQTLCPLLSNWVLKKHMFSVIYDVVFLKLHCSFCRPWWCYLQC